MRRPGRIVDRADPTALRSFAEMIVDHSADSDRHCLHSYSFGSATEVFQDMSKLEESGDFRCVVGFDDNQFLGGIACEFDPDRRRVWLRGPYVQDWDDTLFLEELWTSLLTQLPFVDPQLDSFVHTEHKAGIEFYQSRGLDPVRRIHAYTAQRPNKLASPQVSCTPLAEPFVPAFVALHSTCFPNSQDGNTCLEEAREGGKIFQIVQGDRFVGYIHLSVGKNPPEGYVEYLGVEPSARGQGIGGVLLRWGMDWCFREQDLPKVSLTVDEELTGAQGLYERCGFVLQTTGLHQQRPSSNPS